MEMPLAEGGNQKWIFKNEDNLRGLRDNIKHPKICFTWALGGSKKEKGVDNAFDEIMAENLLILKKEMVFQVQEVQISKDEHRKQQNSVKQLSLN